LHVAKEYDMIPADTAFMGNGLSRWRDEDSSRFHAMHHPLLPFCQEVERLTGDHETMKSCSLPTPRSGY
jgi:hypothetical protein